MRALVPVLLALLPASVAAQQPPVPLPGFERTDSDAATGDAADSATPPVPAPIIAPARPTAGSPHAPRVPVIIIIDTREILRDAAVARDVREQVDSRRRQFQQDAQDEEEQLRATEEQLRASRDAMSEDEFNIQRRDYEQRLLSSQQKLQERRHRLDQSVTEAMKRIDQALQKAVTEVADEHEASLVLSKEQVVLAEQSLDVTAEVLGRLDASLAGTSIRLPE